MLLRFKRQIASAGIPMSGLTLWLNGRNGITNGVKVSNWPDQSGNTSGGHVHDVSQSTGANQPTGSTTINGKTSVDFTVTGPDVLKNSTVNQSNLFTSTGITVSGVWKYTGSVAMLNGSVTYSTPRVLGDAGFTGVGMMVGQGGGGSNVQVSLTFAQTTSVFFSHPVTCGLQTSPYYVTCTYDGSNVNTYVNANAPVTTSTTLTSAILTNQYWIGAGGESTSEDWSGSIGEVICWNRALSSSEVTSVQAFLQTNWGF